MLKKMMGRKRLLLIGVAAALLSGCQNRPAEPDSENEADSRVEEIVQPEADGRVEEVVQSGADSRVELTAEGKAFLMQMCGKMKDFNEQTVMDETFWRDFLFYFYTGAPAEAVETELVYREDPGLEETVVKVSRQEAEERARLVFGAELPDLRPSFEEMEKGQAAFYYEDGCYYIGVSDFPDYQYAFSGTAPDEKSDTDQIVTYSIGFMGENDAGTVSFAVSPADNAYGFVIRSKTTRMKELP